MLTSKRVSGKTHTKKQLDDYANQNNPNSKAYKARMLNEKKIKKSSKQKAKRYAKLESKLGLDCSLDWMCYSNPYDFD